MNRYTQLTGSQFTPLSMQELAIAPGYLRGKHDEAAAKQEALRGQMAVAGDVLKYHQDEFGEYQNEINNLINQESENLSKYGYSKNSGANLNRLNRYYNQLMSPNGRIGQMIAAKKAYTDRYNTYIENATKEQKIPLSIAQRGWENHLKSYTGYDGAGGISQVGQYGAPEKWEVSDAIATHTKDLGTVQRVLAKNQGASVQRDPEGHLVVVNHSGEKIVDSNLEPALAALSNVIKEFNTPGAKGYDYAEYSGKDVNQIANEIYAGILSKIKYKEADTRKSTTSVHGVKNSNDLAAESAFNSFSNGISNIDMTPKSNVSTVEELNHAYNNLKTKVDNNTATDEDLIEFDKLSFLKNSVDANMSDAIKDDYAKAMKYSENELDSLMSKEGLGSVKDFNINNLKGSNDGDVVDTYMSSLSKIGNSALDLFLGGGTSKLANKPAKYTTGKDRDSYGVYYTYNGKNISLDLVKKMKDFSEGKINNKYKSKEMIAYDKQIPKNLNTVDKYTTIVPETTQADSKFKTVKKGIQSGLNAEDLFNTGNTIRINSNNKGLEVINPSKFDSDDINNLNTLMKTSNTFDFGVAENLQGRLGVTQGVKYSFVVPKSLDNKSIGGVTVKEGQVYDIAIDAKNTKDTNGRNNIVGHTLEQASTLNPKFKQFNIESTPFINENGDEDTRKVIDPLTSKVSNYGSLLNYGMDISEVGKVYAINTPLKFITSGAPESITYVNNVSTNFIQFMEAYHPTEGKDVIKALNNAKNPKDKAIALKAGLFLNPAMEKYREEFFKGSKVVQYLKE